MNEYTKQFPFCFSRVVTDTLTSSRDLHNMSVRTACNYIRARATAQNATLFFFSLLLFRCEVGFAINAQQRRVYWIRCWHHSGRHYVACCSCSCSLFLFFISLSSSNNNNNNKKHQWLFSSFLFLQGGPLFSKPNEMRSFVHVLSLSLSLSWLQTTGANVCWCWLWAT